MRYYKNLKDRLNNKTLGIVVYIIVLLIISSMLLSVQRNNKDIFGYTARIVISGSMEPSIKVNSLNIIKVCDIDNIEVGDVVCFSYNSDIIHRVIGIDKSDNGDKILYTKGDANDNPDSIEINNEILLGKVIFTFNGLSKLINKYSTSPGDIDSGLLIRNLITLAIVVGIIAFMISWIMTFISIAIKSLRGKDEFSSMIDIYIDDIDELILYKEMLLSLKDENIKNKPETRMRFIFNRLAKAKAEINMHNMHSNIREFKRQVAYCKYMDKLGELLDGNDDNKTQKGVDKKFKQFRKK